LETRGNHANTVYSAQASDDTVEKRRKESIGFIEAVTAIFIHDKEESLAYVEDWSSTIAKERAQQSVPLYEVMEHLGQLRKIYWTCVRHFFEKVDRAGSQDALR
ncbi:hypothetical protein RLJ57_00980, partial [Streptococcus pneumoniae]|nr:hypothetical protein [Streptococcus pneumoniae]